MDKITIVVPCYNVENNIEKCISSIKNQSYTNFEAIFVDDGSKADNFRTRANDDQQLESAVVLKTHVAVIQFHFHLHYPPTFSPNVSG